MRDFIPSVVLALSACLNVLLKRSTSQLEEGWYGAQRKCLMLFSFINCANVICGPLSDTSCS